MKKSKKIKSQTSEKTKDSDEIILDGTVLEAHPNASFDVKLDNEHIVFCVISGKIRKARIRVLPDDRVQIGVSPYDLNRGRIKYVYKKDQKKNDSRV